MTPRAQPATIPVYLLAGLGLVLIFSVTRVVFVPFGDVAAFAALSLAAFETGRMPLTIGLVLTLALLAVVAHNGIEPHDGQAGGKGREGAPEPCRPRRSPTGRFSARRYSWIL
jgi:hypothetical protein